jgi:hypothetical protein
VSQATIPRGMRAHIWPRLSPIAGILLAAAAGAAIPLAPPKLIVLGIAACVVIGSVAIHPPLAAYALIAITPLVAGIDRGRLVPVLRPAEALAILLAAGLVLGWLMRRDTTAASPWHFTRLDGALLALAVLSSVVPLAWMLARGQQIASDDLLYALMLWKYYGVFMIIRASVRSEREIRICLWLSLAAAFIVAVIAILESLQLFGTIRILSSYYTPYGNVQALQNSRGGSTLALPIAAADLLILNLAIVGGFLARQTRHTWLLLSLGVLFVLGVVASGEFSAFIALVIGLIAIAALTRRARLIVAFVPALLAAGYLLRPVIERRLSGFQSASGLPVSWEGRIHNLTSYFWPQLFSHGNFILGVRVAARVATSTMATGYVWIESGYTWLLWSGGIPLVLAFFYFLAVGLPPSVQLARGRMDAVGVAGLSVAVGLIVISILMTIDPHLTYRGSADLLFALLGLAWAGGSKQMRTPGQEGRELESADRG